MFPRRFPSGRGADAAVVFTPSGAELALRLRDGTVHTLDTGEEPARAAAEIVKHASRSRRAILAFGHSEMFTRVLPAPPGIDQGLTEWLASATQDAFEGAPCARGCLWLGDPQRPLALAFAVPAALLRARLRWARLAGLTPVAVVPAYLAAPNLVLRVNESRPEPRNTLVIDYWDTKSVLFSAVVKDRILIARNLTRDQLPTAHDVLDEARRTISYVRERHQGLVLDEFSIRGDAPGLAPALAGDGLSSLLTSEPGNRAAALLEPLSMALTGNRHFPFDLLPPEERHRSARQGVAVALGAGALVVAGVLLHLSAKAHELELDLGRSLARAARRSVDHELLRQGDGLVGLRKAAEQQALYLAEARATGTPACASTLAKAVSLASTGIRFSECASNADGFVASGFVVSHAREAESSLEKLTREIATGLGAADARIEVHPCVDDRTVLGDRYSTGEWVAEKFSVKIERPKTDE